MRPLLLLLVSALLTGAAVVPGVLLAGGPAPPVAATARTPAVDPGGAPAAPLAGMVAGTVAQARAVLADWDERRAAAWAAGDVGALRQLYVPGSAAGRHDRAMLSRWTARGLAVDDLDQVLLAVEVLDRGPGRLELEVTDRLAGGRAVGRGLDVPLPEDAPTTRRVTLVRTAADWRVAEVE